MQEELNLINQCKRHLTRYEYPQVIECCDEILKNNPESWWPLKYKAIALYQTEQYDKAIPIYKKHHQLYPDDEDTIIILIEMLEKQGKYEEALKLYQKLPEYDKFKNKERRLKSQMKLFPEIIREYDDKLENVENLKQIHEYGLKRPDVPKRIEKHIKSIVLHEEKAIFQYINGEYDNAYQTFQKVSKSYHIIKDYLNNNYKHEKWYERLNKLLIQYSPSREFFHELFNIESNIDICYDRLNHTLTSFEDFLVYTDILLEENPNNTEILELSGKISLYKDPDYSLKCWKKILELDTENKEAIKRILYIYSHQYSKDRALKLINSKLYIKDMQTDLLVEKIRILESMTLYDEAIEAYDEYLSLDLPDGLINHKLTIFDKLRCMEEKALSLYLEDKLKESYEIYKKISQNFNNTQRQPSVISAKEWYIEDWYKVVLQESIDKSKDNFQTFYKKFYENKENIQLWVEKIEHINKYFHITDPLLYCGILSDKFPLDNRIKLVKAKIYYKRGRLEDALEILEEILEKEAENSIAQDIKFKILIESKEYDKAYVHLKRMGINIKEMPNLLSNLAKHLLEEKQYEKAGYCYELLLKNNWDTNRIIIKLKYIWNKTKNTESQNKSPYYLDWIDLINYKHKKYECSTCGGKLIPIRYGYFTPKTEEIGVKYHMGGCCVSTGSPTDYCNKCEKEINMGTYGIDITDKDYRLLGYTQANIIWLTKYIEKNPTNNITEIEEETNKKLSFDKKEYETFIEKLEQIGHIKIEEKQIKLNNNYKKFHNNIY